MKIYTDNTIENTLNKHRRQRDNGTAGPYCTIDFEVMNRAVVDDDGHRWFSSAYVAERRAFNKAFADVRKNACWWRHIDADQAYQQEVQA